MPSKFDSKDLDLQTSPAEVGTRPRQTCASAAFDYLDLILRCCCSRHDRQSVNTVLSGLYEPLPPNACRTQERASRIPVGRAEVHAEGCAGSHRGSEGKRGCVSVIKRRKQTPYSSNRRDHFVVTGLGGVELPAGVNVCRFIPLDDILIRGQHTCWAAAA